ncbi:MAG: hypothetical protein JWO60_252, partial [Frankiales bacterium]|nr:hypothetical protein [Frankiales bacterium]
GTWTPFADMSGEVQTLVDFPDGVQGVADTYAGRQEWRWTAGFEAFDAFPARLGSTPTGTYRFVVDGTSRVSGSDAPYRLESAPFRVSPWTGLQLGDARLDGSFRATSTYPRTYRSAFRTIRDDGRTTICRTCSFRPWAASAEVEQVDVTLTGADGSTRVHPATLRDGRWTVDLGDAVSAVVAAGGARDANGETNGTALVLR